MPQQAVLGSLFKSAAKSDLRYMIRKPPIRRFGVAELYGHSLAHLAPSEVRRLAVASHVEQQCPFRGATCRKKNGVCSLRLYDASENNGEGTPADAALVSVCPERFKEAGTVPKWIGKILLGTDSPAVVGEVEFLQGETEEDDEQGEHVGRIDNILVRLDTSPLVWCAVELQAVYFSGPGMTSQLKAFSSWRGPGVPFPDKVRRPDYRSSGPKRLMPQLQTKVPTLRRWGKKMAVLTDRSFFENMGTMEVVPDVSNCDIVWFVVDYEWTGSSYRLVPFECYFITLERAIEGLIAGDPVALPEFERRIMEKLNPLPKKGRAR